MVLVFDIDDTLYEELTFVKSGFNEVCKFLCTKYSLDSQKLYNSFLEELEQGRGKIFDNVLIANNIFSKKLVKQCLSVYRLHKPTIELYDDAYNFITKHRSIPIYIVTDGNKIVQWNKVKSLGLDSIAKKVFITHRYGIDKAKPSPYCFFKICKIENEIPENIIYFGDNLKKDFVGIKPYGFKTVRLLRGNYMNLNLELSNEADIKVTSFYDVTDELLSNLLIKK